MWCSAEIKRFKLQYCKHTVHHSSALAWLVCCTAEHLFELINDVAKQERKGEWISGAAGWQTLRWKVAVKLVHCMRSIQNIIIGCQSDILLFHALALICCFSLFLLLVMTGCRNSVCIYKWIINLYSPRD